MNYKSIGKHWKTSVGIPGEYQSGACSLQLSTSAITSHKSNATHCHIGLVVPTCSFQILPIQMEGLHMITHASVKNNVKHSCTKMVSEQFFDILCISHTFSHHLATCCVGHPWRFQRFHPTSSCSHFEKSLWHPQNHCLHFCLKASASD